MKTVLVIFMVLLTCILVGCSAIPTMQYCDKVDYNRTGNKVLVYAECSVPVGGGAMGLPSL